MRILIATNSYPTTKNPTHQVFVKNICEGLKQSGCTVDVAYNLYFRFFKSEIETGGMFSSILKIIFLWFSYLPFILLRAKKFDIIYSHAPVLPGFFMWFAQKIHGVKHVTYVHGSVNIYSKKRGRVFRIAKFTMNQCHTVFTNSSYMQKRLIDDYGIQSVVVTPGYNSGVFYDLGTEKTCDILYAGSSVKRKGLGIFLQTVQQHLDFYKKNNLVIKIYCSGAEKNQFLKFSKKHGLDQIIQFGERLQESDLVKAYNSAKIVVFPSIEEPLGLVGIEAIACGAFLVASDTGGIPEYVKHGVNGYLFESGNPRELHKYLKKALDKIDQSEPINYKSREDLQPFSLQAGINQTIEHFQKML